MKSDHDIIRDRMYSRMGICSVKKRDPVVMGAEIRAMTSKLEEIVSLARPRLIMGGIRHGSNWDHESLMDYMQGKFDAYRETGNFELLVDLFNFVAVEGQLKTHPKFHFNPLDRNK